MAQLSETGKHLVEEKIRAKKWKSGTENEELSQAATQFLLKDHLDRNLQYREVLKLEQDGILAKGSLSKIEEECSGFRLGQLKLNKETILGFIRESVIVCQDVSSQTCKRFRKGQNINDKAFKVFCQVLNVPDQDVIDQPQPQNLIIYHQERKLIEALLELNHKNQFDEFSNFKKQSKFVSICIDNHQFQCVCRLKLLLNSLLFDRPDNSIQLPGLIINFPFAKSRESKSKQDNDNDQFAKTRKSKSKLDNDNNQLWTTLGKKLKSYSCNVSGKSPAPDIAKAVADYLRTEPIILVFSDEIGSKIAAEEIQNKFWRELTRLVQQEIPQNSQEQYQYLLLCYHLQRDESWDLPNTIKLNVVEKFDSQDLSEWLKVRLVKKLLGSSIELDEIWKLSDEGQPKQLVKALYEKYQISWEERSRQWEEL